MKNRMLVIIFVILLNHLSNLLKAQNSFNEPEIYRVIAISNADTTVQSVSNEIELFYPLAIQIPSAFTPNGDGLNDHFTIVAEGVDQFKLIVFNRWGNILFQSEDLSNSWDGTYQGNMVPLGAYNYEIYAQGKEFGHFHKAGQILIALN